MKSVIYIFIVCMLSLQWGCSFRQEDKQKPQTTPESQRPSTNEKNPSTAKDSQIEVREEETVITGPTNTIPSEAPLHLDLFEAILANEATEIQGAIKREANLNRYNDDGLTPLMLAVQLNQSITIHLLLKNGAVLLFPGRNGEETALSLAQKLNSPSLSLLLETYEKHRLQFEKIIIDKNWQMAQAFHELQHLPVDLKIFENKTTVIHILNEMSSERIAKGSQAVLFLEQLLKRGASLNGVETLATKVAFQRENKALLLQMIQSLGPQFSQVSLVQTLSSGDSQWFLEVLATLNQQKVALDPAAVTEALKIQMHQVSELSQKDPQHAQESFIRALTLSSQGGYQLSRSGDSPQGLTLLQLALKQLRVNQMNFLTLQTLIQYWKKKIDEHKELAPFETFDNLLESLFKGVYSASNSHLTLDIKTLKTTIYALKSLFDTTDSICQVCFETIITSKTHLSQEKDLLNLLIEVSTRLPHQILAKALYEEKLELFEILLNTPSKYDPKDQTEAILAAVESSVDGDVALLKVFKLNSVGFKFNNLYGEKSLLKAFSHIWNGNIKYRDLVFFLLSKGIDPSSKNLLKSHRLSDSIMAKQIQFYGENKSDFSLILNIITASSKIQPYFLDNHQYINPIFELIRLYLLDFQLNEETAKKYQEFQQTLNTLIQKSSELNLAISLRNPQDVLLRAEEHLIGNLVLKGLSAEAVATSRFNRVKNFDLLIGKGEYPAEILFEIALQLLRKRSHINNIENDSFLALLEIILQEMHSSQKLEELARLLVEKRRQIQIPQFEQQCFSGGVTGLNPSLLGATLTPGRLLPLEKIRKKRCAEAPLTSDSDLEIAQAYFGQFAKLPHKETEPIFSDSDPPSMSEMGGLVREHLVYKGEERFLKEWLLCARTYGDTSFIKWLQDLEGQYHFLTSNPDTRLCIP